MKKDQKRFDNSQFFQDRQTLLAGYNDDSSARGKMSSRWRQHGLERSSVDHWYMVYSQRLNERWTRRVWTSLGNSKKVPVMPDAWWPNQNGNRTDLGTLNFDSTSRRQAAAAAAVLLSPAVGCSKIGSCMYDMHTFRKCQPKVETSSSSWIDQHNMHETIRSLITAVIYHIFYKS